MSTPCHIDRDFSVVALAAWARSHFHLVCFSYSSHFTCWDRNHLAPLGPVVLGPIRPAACVKRAGADGWLCCASGLAASAGAPDIPTTHRTCAEMEHDLGGWKSIRRTVNWFNFDAGSVCLSTLQPLSLSAVAATHHGRAALRSVLGATVGADTVVIVHRDSTLETLRR